MSLQSEYKMLDAHTRKFTGDASYYGAHRLQLEVKLSLEMMGNMMS